MRFQTAAFDETVFQEQLVEHLGTDHCSISVSAKQIRECLPKVIWHCETPILRTAPVPLWLLSKLVREHNFKVVLTGEGADEIFGGYNIFKEAKVRNFWGRQPLSALRPRLLEKLYPYVFDNPVRGCAFLYQFFAVEQTDLVNPLFSHQIRWRNGRRNTAFFSSSLRDQVGGVDSLQHVASSLPDDFAQRDLFSRTQALEVAIFLSNYLLSSQGDRMLMANSIEGRFPYLDHRVIEFACRVPRRFRIHGLDEKFLLKQAARKVIPDELVDRAKQPYRAPISRSFFGDVRMEYVEEMLSETQILAKGYFNADKVGRLVAKCRNRQGSLLSERENMALVAILSTQLLDQQFVRDFPAYRAEEVSSPVVYD